MYNKCPDIEFLGQRPCKFYILIEITKLPSKSVFKFVLSTVFCWLFPTSLPTLSCITFFFFFSFFLSRLHTQHGAQHGAWTHDPNQDLSSWRELRSRVRCLTNRATQAPPCQLFILANLIDEKWHFLVFLACILLIIADNVFCFLIMIR